MPADPGARPLDRQDPLPLWAQLQRDLSRRLTAGDFATAFPGELDIARGYDVSRHTVREALRRLREAGVLDSARGRPTQVRAAIEQPLGSLYSLFREVENRGMTQTSEILDQSLTTDAEAAAALGLPERARLFHLERVRLADGVPLAHDRVWLPASLAAPLVKADFTRGALYDELAERCGVRVTGGRERISATVPAPAERALLAVPRGVACLTVERSGYADTRLVERRVTVVRGDRWSVVADWTARGWSVGAVAGPG
ncbi:GntR family transcriptional regulator [Kineosporia sp. R_H_3]|uniref:GntR family transcriptional regulator n=1 Tax=Kineosporia sp. R_H_3 TaxID=1961848 RepID=UPI001E3CE24B|nr:GntR family transcriptional regulator [Kineosporia sp. R_H_3]